MDKDEYRGEVLKELREHNEKLERIEESNAAIAIFTLCLTVFVFLIMLFVIAK